MVDAIGRNSMAIRGNAQAKWNRRRRALQKVRIGHPISSVTAMT